jgi:hypothetical protein
MINNISKKDLIDISAVISIDNVKNDPPLLKIIKN